MDAIKTLDYKGHKIELHYDENAESPRKWDNVGVMVCWHRRHNLGDKHTHADPQAFHEWIEENEPDAVVLPLFLYDHSGITISTGSFSCPWDSGQVGFIYVTKARALAEYGDVGKTWDDAAKAKAAEHLKGEVTVYDQFLTGQVYGYRVEGPLCEDSCWGFIGDEDYVMEEAKSAVDWAVKHEAEESARAAQVTAL